MDGGKFIHMTAKLKKKLKVNLYYLKRIFAYFKPYLWRIILSLLSMGVVGACTAYAAFLVQPALDEIFIKKDKHALMWIPIQVVAVFLVKGIFQIFQNYLMQSSGLRVLQTLRNDLYKKMIRLPLEFFEQKRVGMLMSRMISDVELIRNSVPEVVSSVRHIFTMVGLIFVAFYRDAYLASWAMVVLPIAFLPVVQFGKKLRKLGRKNQEKIADISSLLQEKFSGISVVKAFSTEHKEENIFKKENKKLIKIGLKGVFYNALSSPIMEVIGSLGIGIVIWYGGNQVIMGQSTPGTFFSFITALMMLYEPFKKLNKSNMNIQKALAGAERVFEILDSPIIKEENEGKEDIKPPFKQLDFIDVSFRYPETRDDALKNINFTIKAGEKIAIVGPSGSGKTTLANLIPRFYEPYKGKIILNNKDLTQYKLKSLRKFVGIVSQDTILFNTTIRENIIYGLEKEDIDQKKLESICKAAYADGFIKKLPKGYDTVIGERGVKLSGGEKQRLSIARTLLKDPPLLILDEATSSLDSESEEIVHKALLNLMKNRTCIIIAHRLSTVLSSDRIVVMHKGKIVDIGNHKELLQRCALYQKLYSIQFREDIMFNS